MNAKGGFRYCTYQGGLTAELFVQLLRKMMRHRSKPVHLVVDGLPAHRTALVKAYVASTDGMLTLHFLRRGETLRDKIETQLDVIKRTPQLVRSIALANT